MAIHKYPVIKADFEEYAKAPEAKAKVYEPNHRPKVGDTIIMYEKDIRKQVTQIPSLVSGKKVEKETGKMEEYFTGREKRFVITEVTIDKKKVSTITFRPEESK